MSRFQREYEQRLEGDIQKLITATTGFTILEKNFEIAEKFTSSNLKYHRFPDTDPMTVQSKFDGILVKMQVMCKPEIPEFLKALFGTLKSKLNGDNCHDVHYRVLDFLMYCSTNYIDTNLYRDPNYAVLNKHSKKALSISSADSLEDWKFESSSLSEEEFEQEMKYEEVKVCQEEPPQIVEKYPNQLWYMPNIEKRTYSDFVSTETHSIKESITVKGVMANEKDLVAGLLLAFLGFNSELFTYEENWKWNNIKLTHMTEHVLLASLTPLLQLADKVHLLRKPFQMIQKPLSQPIECLIQEQMWLSIQNMISDFELYVSKQIETLVDHMKIYPSDNHTALTLITLTNQLREWQHIFQKIYKLVVQIQLPTNTYTFASSTLQLLFDACLEDSLLQKQGVNYLQRIFILALQPYLFQIEKYLDDATAQNFADVPSFMVNSVEQLKSIAQAYHIFRNVNMITIRRIHFKEEFNNKLQQLLGSKETSIQYNQIEQLSLKGTCEKLQFGFEVYSPKDVAPQVETYTEMKDNWQFVRVFEIELQKAIQAEYQIIQDTLLGYLDQIQFKDVLKFIRSLFLFERADLMEKFILLIPESQTQAKIRFLQIQIQDNFKESHIHQCEFQLSCSQNPLFQILHKTVNFKISLPHPIDLIINDNCIILYNKIMQFLLYFKNARLNIQRTHYSLMRTKHKKYLHFCNQMIQFMVNYEYFIFISVIQVQTEEFMKKIESATNFQFLIDSHNQYIKTISDKIFLNQKYETIQEVIYNILDIVHNFPQLADRIKTMKLIDEKSQKIEALRIDSDYKSMKEQFSKNISGLILLFDRDQRMSHATESIQICIYIVIECMMKVNFNRFYS